MSKLYFNQARTAEFIKSVNDYLLGLLKRTNPNKTSKYFLFSPCSHGTFGSKRTKM